MVDRKSLGIFGSLMTGFNTVVKSVGSSITSSTILNTYKTNMLDHLNPLPITDELKEKIAQWMAEGSYLLAYKSENNIPKDIIINYIQKDTPARVDSFIICLHMLGYLCIVMVVIVGLLFTASVLARSNSKRQYNLR
jgi:hypothetical protein